MVSKGSHESRYCGTDVEINSGAYGWSPPGRERLILGHESLGRVVDLGPDRSLKAVDLIVGIVRRPDPVPCRHRVHRGGPGDRRLDPPGGCRWRGLPHRCRQRRARQRPVAGRRGQGAGPAEQRRRRLGQRQPAALLPGGRGARRRRPELAWATDHAAACRPRTSPRRCSAAPTTSRSSSTSEGDDGNQGT